MAIHLVRPADVDDPARPSGGNVYDRRIASALGLVEHSSIATVPDGALVLLDGLLTSSDLIADASRVRLVVLVHLPRWEPWEGPLLRAVAGVIATSRWTRDELVERYGLERVFVAEPGVDPAPCSVGSPSGGALLSVGAVTRLKGYDVLAAALASLSDLDWTCRGVGSVEIEPDFASSLPPVVRLSGAMARADLDATYAEADLLVLASRAETYGMVVTEALARGVPVVASDVGGVREALGGGGVLVPVGDADALGAALRAWLTSPSHRSGLRAAARTRRAELTGWDRTAALVSDALEAVR
ncbi:glycosyltransferase family 4 protein [Nocardioides sp. CN2-186]|uniref:glycosyltransferase family 4 protein n=1 Tax=Nocardioides tweenelious TaxID=3156607 RepID=UPI0032B35B59